MADPWDSSPIVKAAKAPAEPWDSSPIVKAAKAPSNPWDSSPIVKAAPAAAPKPAAAPGWLDQTESAIGRVAQGAKDFGAGVIDSFTPKQSRRDAAHAQLVKDDKDHPYIPEWMLAGSRALDHNVGASARALKDDFTQPLDKSKGMFGLTARVGKTAFDSLNYVTSPASAAGEALVGEPIGQRVLGMDPTAVGNVAAIALPGTASRIAKAADASKEQKALLGTTKLSRPEMVDVESRQAAPHLRRVLSQTDLAKHQHLSKLGTHYKALSDATVDEMHDVKRVAEGQEPNTPLTPARQAVADQLKETLAAAGKDLNASTGVPLREGYFPHKWEKPGASPDELPRVGVGKTGSGQQMKARSFATLDEGLQQGFKETYNHPLDAVAHYLEDTYNAIGHQRSLDVLKKRGHAQWYGETQVPTGYTKLEGRNTTRLAKPLSREIKGIPEAEGLQELTGQVPQRVLAAPDSVARLHNNRLQKSMADGDWSGLFKPARALTNAARTSTLGGGALAHTTLTSAKGMGSKMATGFNEILQGHPLRGLKSMAHGTVAWVPVSAPFTLVGEGGRAEKALLEHGPRSEWEHLYVNAGGRVSQTASYETAMRPNMYESAKRGTFKQDLFKAFEHVGKAQGGKAWAVAAKGVGESFARAAETANHFTFKYQVPRIKLGVAKSEIESWLKNNPGASAAEKADISTQIVGSIDDRFGEMVADNNFWSTHYKELARIGLLSPSWVQGNVRLFTDAAKDIGPTMRSLPKGKGMGVDTQAAFGVLASRTLVAGTMTYILTGSPPQSIMDYIAPRTGGKNKDGSDERMTILSSMKEIDQQVYGDGMLTEAYGKMNPAVAQTIQLLEDKDYFGKQIYNPNDSRLDQAGDAAKYIAGNSEPIGLRGDNNPDSQIPQLAKFLGMQAAGKKYYDPEGYAAGKYKRNAYEKKQADRSKARSGN